MPQVSILVSEELDEPLHLSTEGRLLVATDPLDGSSNLDVNVTVGTIFSVLEAAGGLLQPGQRQLAAGYIAYGPASVLAVRVKGATSLFTLDDAGIWQQSLETAEVPQASAEYAINSARERFWDAATRAMSTRTWPAKPGRRASATTCAGSARWWPTCTAS